MTINEETNDTSSQKNESEKAPELKLTGYCMKRKSKDVPILDAVITRTAKNGYIASGNDGQGNKMTTLLGAEKALACIAAGLAKKGWADPE